MKSYQQLFAELKRRHVFKVSAVYGAVAFLLLQVADLLGQGLRLPDSFLPFLTALVLLGFPLALVLAWSYELTTEGIQRTETAEAGEIERIVAQPASRRWPDGIMALGGLAALVAGAAWVLRPGESADAESDAGARPNAVHLTAGPSRRGRSRERLMESNQQGSLTEWELLAIICSTTLLR